MSLFSRGFAEFFDTKQYSDVTIRLKLEPKSRKTAPARVEFSAHRIILGYHSEVFLDAFKQAQREDSQKASQEPPNLSPRDLAPSSDGDKSPVKRRARSKQPYALTFSIKSVNNKFFVDMECLDERVFAYFKPFFEFLYGTKVEINENSAFPLLILSQRFKVDPLVAQVTAFLTSFITRESAMRVLKVAIEFDQSDIRDKCVGLIARHFQASLDDEAISLDDFNWIPLRDFQAILSHPLLAVKEEYTVYRLIRGYVKKAACAEQLTQEDKVALFSTLRLAYLKFNQLEKVIAERLIPEDLINEAVMFRLASFERPNREIKEEDLPLRLRRRTVIGRMFEYDHDFDDKGVIYWLSTTFGKSEWKNASLTGMIKVSYSSIEKGKIHNIVDREPVECWTKDIPSSWFAIDLRQGRLVPTRYTLRHGAASRLDSLRTWVLQASHDGQVWDDISRHQNDTSLNSGFATHTWQLNVGTVAYRHFRLLQTGHNSGNNNFLAISGFELYGEFYMNPPKSVPQPPPSAATTNAAGVPLASSSSSSSSTAHSNEGTLSVSPPSGLAGILNSIPGLQNVSSPADLCSF